MKNTLIGFPDIKYFFETRSLPSSHRLGHPFSLRRNAIYCPGIAVEGTGKLPMSHPRKHLAYDLAVLSGGTDAVDKLVPRHRQLMLQHPLHNTLAHFDTPLGLILSLTLRLLGCLQQLLLSNLSCLLKSRLRSKQRSESALRTETNDG